MCVRAGILFYNVLFHCCCSNFCHFVYLFIYLIISFCFVCFFCISLFRIGLCGFDNPMRDPKTDELKRHVGQVNCAIYTNTYEISNKIKLKFLVYWRKKNYNIHRSWCIFWKHCLLFRSKKSNLNSNQQNATVYLFFFFVSTQTKNRTLSSSGNGQCGGKLNFYLYVFEICLFVHLSVRFFLYLMLDSESFEISSPLQRTIFFLNKKKTIKVELHLKTKFDFQSNGNAQNSLSVSLSNTFTCMYV